MTSSGYRFVVLPLCFAVIPLVCIPAAEWGAVSCYGSLSLCWLLLWIPLFFSLPVFAAVPTFFVALLGLIFRRFRRNAAVVALCLASFVLAFIVSLQIGNNVRMSAFHRLAERSKPLIVAIQAFEQRHGHPPESLQALVPEFIVSVPSTGMKAYPNYEYSTVSTNYYDNPWALVVFTPSGAINFDQFMYFPRTNYPEADYGGSLERVGDWAYVHE